MLGQLSLDDIKAMRKAKMAFFVAVQGGEDIFAQGHAKIRLTFSRDLSVFTPAEKRLFPSVTTDDESERTRTISLPGAVSQTILAPDHEEEGFPKGVPIIARYLEMFCQQEGYWTLLTNYLKPGDRLSLRGIGDYKTSPLMWDAGIHGDAFYLHIFRDGTRTVRLDLPTSPSLDNPARAITPAYSAKHGTNHFDPLAYFPHLRERVEQ